MLTTLRSNMFTTSRTVLAAGFAESGITDIDAPYPSTRLSFTDTYDFDSDSDLEDQDEGGLQSMQDESHAEVGRVADESPALADAEVWYLPALCNPRY